MDAFPLSSDLLGKSASAYEHLRRAVSRGQLRPGRRLSATGLAAAFRISETPIREALVRLATEGFLTWEPSKGHFTKAVTLAEQQDLHQVIAINLMGCLRQDGERLGQELESVGLALAAAFETPPNAPDAADQTVQLLEDLGGAMVERSGNRVLCSVMSILFDRVWLIRRLDVASPVRVLLTRQRIAGVVAALQSRDVATALAILSLQLAERRDRLPELVDAANAAAAQASYP